MRSGKPKKTFKIKPVLRLRIRCAEDHKDPWLRRLYVLWAVAPAEGGGEAESAPEGGAAKPRFFLGQTSVEGKTRKRKGRTRGGYLAPLANDTDPALTKALPQAPDVKYEFYFVRHPGADFPRQMQEQLNKNFESAKKAFGEPHVMAPTLETVGKVKELVLKIPEDPAYFLPKGSDFYDGWVLFRDMPGTGSNQRKSHVQCEILLELVTRLQFHLGRMRYLVGISSNPYLPSASKYYNLGLFDTITWNSVLKWQRHATAGEAEKLIRPPSRTLDADFKPTLQLTKKVERSAAKAEMRRSHAFTDSIPADSGEATCSGADQYPGVVAEAAGDGIRKWLENDLRKPGRVLVPCPDSNGWSNWIADDMQSTVQALDLLLKGLGAPGFGVNHSFRDARIGVKTAGGGAIVQSIHKTGFAMDLAMKKFVAPRESKNALKLYFGPHQDSRYPDKSMKWTVWAKIDAYKAQRPRGPETMKGVLMGVFEAPEFASVPGPLKDPETLAPLVEFADSIMAWRYAPDDSSGGGTYPFSETGQCFLNLSRLIAPPSPFMMKPINAHKAGWQALIEKTVKIADKDAYKRVLWRLGNHAKRKDDMITIDGHDYPANGMQSFRNRHTSWAKHLARYGASPTVFVSPGTKQGQAIMKKLRRIKRLRGEVIIEADAADAHEMCLPTAADREYSEETGRLKISQETLGRKTEFPKFDFYVIPVTDPLIKEDAEFGFPLVSGYPGHMEWWHFQWIPGYGGNKWADLVKEIGWTDEGLGWCSLEGKKVVYEKTIYGHAGLGYLSSGKGKAAR